MELHNLKSKTYRRISKRIGRGGKRGTTSGRGTKGQKSRSGHKIRPAVRDLMMKIPKSRGFRFKSLSKDFSVIGLDAIDKNFKAGEKVTPKTLAVRGIVFSKKGSKPKIKVLGEGKITKKVILDGLAVSKSAADKIIALGGEIRNLNG